MLRGSLARRMLKMAGPRYGVTSKPSRRRLVKASDERDVWLIRHGETDANAGDEPRIRGVEDVPLTDKGQGQAVALGAEIANSGGVDMVVHSGLSRARDTANEVAMASHATLSPSLGLQPWNLGFLTGMPVKDAAPFITQHVKETPETAVMGGESFNDFKKRAFTGLQEALDLSTGQRLAVVSHHWIERLVKAWQAAGSGTDLATDPDVMLEDGNGTGTAELVTLDANAIRQGLRGGVSKRKLNGSSKLYLEVRA
jgi:broad specificity phosphatase PhoE